MNELKSLEAELTRASKLEHQIEAMKLQSSLRDEQIRQLEDQLHTAQRQIKIADAMIAVSTDDLSDIRKRLRGLPESRLTGESGLVAATMRHLDADEAILEDIRTRLLCKNGKLEGDDGVIAGLLKGTHALMSHDAYVAHQARTIVALKRKLRNMRKLYSQSMAHIGRLLWIRDTKKSGG